MDLTQRYTIDKDEITYRIIDGEAVILNTDNGYYYSLNEVGTQIWDDINKGKSVGEIISFLKREYRVPEKQLKNDILDLMEDLKKEKIIDVIKSK